jgi:hypothetical protein
MLDEPSPTGAAARLVFQVLATGSYSQVWLCSVKLLSSPPMT